MILLGMCASGLRFVSFNSYLYGSQGKLYLFSSALLLCGQQNENKSDLILASS